MLDYLRRLPFLILPIFISSSFPAHAFTISINPTEADFGELQGGGPPPQISVTLTPDLDRGGLRVVQGGVRWQNPVSDNPFSYQANFSQDVRVLNPTVIVFTLTNTNRQGTLKNALIVPVENREGGEATWPIGVVKEFTIPVSAFKPCTAADGGCEPKGPECRIQSETKFNYLKVAGYEERVRPGIGAHVDVHFNAFNSYTRPLQSIWEPFGVSGPFQDCCDCGGSNTCPLPINYVRWSATSAKADVTWGAPSGRTVSHTPTSQSDPVEVTITMPSQVDGASVQVGASFVEYFFTMPRSAPSMKVTRKDNGEVIADDAIYCYNITLGYATVKFVDRTKRSILIVNQN